LISETRSGITSAHSAPLILTLTGFLFLLFLFSGTQRAGLLFFTWLSAVAYGRSTPSFLDEHVLAALQGAAQARLYICIYVYSCLEMCIYIYVYIGQYRFGSTLYIYMYACIYVCVYIYTLRRAFIYVYMYIHVLRCVYIYMYI